jgi:hypothetical protein
MTRDKFQLVLRSFNKRRPFQPFTLELVSGGRIAVIHPEALTQQRDLLVFRSTKGTHHVFDYATVVQFIEGTPAG